MLWPQLLNSLVVVTSHCWSCYTGLWIFTSLVGLWLYYRQPDRPEEINNSECNCTARLNWTTAIGLLVLFLVLTGPRVSVQPSTPSTCIQSADPNIPAVLDRYTVSAMQLALAPVAKLNVTQSQVHCANITFACTATNTICLLPVTLACTPSIVLLCQL